MKQANLNVVWLVSEDCPPRGAAYGDNLLSTPALDYLSKNGVVFENAFSTYPVCAPSRFSLVTGMEPASCGPAHHMRASGSFPKEFETYADVFRGAGYYCTNNSKTDYNCDIDTEVLWDDCSAQAHWRGRRTDQPFLAVFNGDDTHESAIFFEEITEVSPEDIELPPYLPDSVEIRRDLARHYTALRKVDNYFGQIIQQLREDNLLESTAIIYSSDHGGVGPRSKRFCYDEGLRVPLVVSIPAAFEHLSPWAKGHKVETPVSLIDIAPTLLSLADFKVPENMHGRALFGSNVMKPAGLAFGGRDRMDERYDFVRTVRSGTFRYIRNYYPDRPHGQHVGFMMLAKGYQAWESQAIAGELDPLQSRFWMEKEPEELYNTVLDPHETENLVGDASLSGTLAHMREQLDKHLLEINDNGFIPEGGEHEGYFESRKKGAYPLSEILELANLSIARDSSNIQYFLTLIQQSENYVVRYWAAIGLRLLGPKAVAALDSIKDLSQNDSSPYVRIVASEILARWSGSRAAVATLVGFLSPDSRRELTLLALNSLTFVDYSLLDSQLETLIEVAKSSDAIVASAAEFLVLSVKGEYVPGSKTFDLESFIDSMGASRLSRD